MVNILSTQRKDYRGHVAHTLSQVGLAGLTRAAAAELAGFNIRLNAICDIPADAELFSPRSSNAAEVNKWRSAYPNLHLGEHAELVSLLLFLCSQSAISLCGQVLSLEVLK